jgi:hypothetical protein
MDRRSCSPAIPEAENRPWPRIKLWQDTLTQFRIDAAGLHPDQIRVDKYHLHVPERFWIDPVPLGPVCFLRFSNDDSDPEIECIPPARGVPLIRDNTYRYQYVSGLGLTASHFEDCIRLARASRLYHFSRPRRLSALGACQALLADMLR